jgi:hypothetical protein
MTKARGLCLEDRDEFAAHDAPLLLWVDHTSKRIEEAVRRVDIADVHVEVAMHHVEDPLGLLFAKQAIVHKDARELVADRAVHQRCGHGRIDAS